MIICFYGPSTLPSFDPYKPYIALKQNVSALDPSVFTENDYFIVEFRKLHIKVKCMVCVFRVKVVPRFYNHSNYLTGQHYIHKYNISSI